MPSTALQMALKVCIEMLDPFASQLPSHVADAIAVMRHFAGTSTPPNSAAAGPPEQRDEAPRGGGARRSAPPGRGGGRGRGRGRGRGALRGQWREPPRVTPQVPRQARAKSKQKSKAKEPTANGPAANKSALKQKRKTAATQKPPPSAARARGAAAGYNAPQARKEADTPPTGGRHRRGRTRRVRIQPRLVADEGFTVAKMRELVDNIGEYSDVHAVQREGIVLGVYLTMATDEATVDLLRLPWGRRGMRRSYTNWHGTPARPQRATRRGDRGGRQAGSTFEVAIAVRKSWSGGLDWRRARTLVQDAMGLPRQGIQWVDVRRVSKKQWVATVRLNPGPEKNIDHDSRTVKRWSYEWTVGVVAPQDNSEGNGPPPPTGGVDADDQ